MDAGVQLEGFIDRFTPEVAADARAALSSLTTRLPTAFRLVYENYNALVIGFASGEKASDAFLSIALYPQYVRLFFLRGSTWRTRISSSKAPVRRYGASSSSHRHGSRRRKS